MKVREIKVGPDDLDRVGEALQSLRACDDVVILRGGALQFPKEQWFQFLQGRYGLVADRRHFAPGAGGKVTPGAEATPEMVLADWWEVVYKPELAQAYAYSNTRQPLHTDNAWFVDAAEMNFFIMEKQAVEGGDQTVYPLARLMEDLGDEEPALLSELTSTPVVIKKGEHDYFNRTTIIALENGPRVYWNYYRTEKPTPEIARMCEAFFQYLERKESTPSVERIHCETGDCLTFNDLKMLHGRTAFAAKLPRDRVFLHSMWRVPRAANG